MSFRNPILAGTTLVRAAIQSANFAAGSSGWQIRANGGAEFNAAIFRGSVEISGAQDLLMYDGTPGLGDLFVALAPTAGNDPYGNQWAQGLTVGNTGGQRIVLGLTGGSPLVYFVSNRSQIQNSSALQVFSQGTGAPSWEQIQLIGPKDSTQLDLAGSTWLSSSADGTQVAQVQEFYVDPAGGIHIYAVTSYYGLEILAGSIVAVQPGTGTSRTHAAVPETWHPMTLATGFVAGPAPFAPPRYWLESTGGGTIVRLSGAVQTTAASGVFATFWTAPSGYVPTYGQHFAVSTKTAAGANSAQYVNVTNTGLVELINVAASGDVIFLDGITYTLT